VNRPPLPNLSVQQLEYLVASVDSPTHAEAATLLGVSSSALSQGLAELSRRVGLDLFEREGRRSVLRPQAEPVLDHARRVLAHTADLQRYVAAARTGHAGQLRIGMIDVAAIDHFAGVLHSLRQDRPELDLHLTVGPSGGLFADLEHGRLDLVVGVEPDRPIIGVGWESLMSEALYVYRRPGSATGPGRSSGPRGESWVSFPEGSHTRRIIDHALRRSGEPFEVVAVSHQPEVLREMVALGLGWTVLPEVQAGRGRSALRRVGDAPFATRVLVVAWRAGAVTPEAAIAVRDSLLAT